MRYCNFVADGQVQAGLVTRTGLVSVKDLLGRLVTTDDLIPAGPALDLSRLVTDQTPRLDPDQVDFAPAVTRPGKILCIGLNYKKHVEESEESLPSEPVVFSKFNNALAAHREVVPVPDEGSQFDYEVELVAVIGRRARNVAVDQALDYVFGYTIGNDLSIRDVQFKEGRQWLLGKTADGFAPVGPYLVTRDQVDPGHLDISLKRNGQTVQSSNTSYMIFDLATIVSYLSRYLTLEAGDIIFTGTPDGVILGQEEGQENWLRPGDRLDASISGLGTLTSYFGQKSQA